MLTLPIVKFLSLPQIKKFNIRRRGQTQSPSNRIVNKLVREQPILLLIEIVKRVIVDLQVLIRKVLGDVVVRDEVHENELLEGFLVAETNVHEWG
jgi:hypothetical protein